MSYQLLTCKLKIKTVHNNHDRQVHANHAIHAVHAVQIFTFPVQNPDLRELVAQRMGKSNSIWTTDCRGLSGIWGYWMDGMQGRAWITLLCVFPATGLGVRMRGHPSSMSIYPRIELFSS